MHLAAYELTATHCVYNDRVRDHGRGVIQLKCTLTVYLLILQPLIDVLLKKTRLCNRRSRALCIKDVHSYTGFYGAKTWIFTVQFYTSRKMIRTRTWWGRKLTTSELDDLPKQVLNYLERHITSIWCSYASGAASILAQRTGILEMAY